MPYWGPSLTTLLFDSTDLQDVEGVTVTDWGEALIAPKVRRGQHDTIGGRDGWLGASLPLDGYNFDVTVKIEGDTEADMWANIDILSDALEGVGGLGELERRLDDGMGSYVATFANGAFAGINSTLLNRENHTLVLTFANLDGRWRDDES